MAKTVFDAVLILSAVDKVTRVIASVTQNAEKKLSALQKKTDKFSKSAFAFGRNAAVTGAVLAAPLVYATNEAIKFEDKMADVGKVLNLKTGSEELNQIGSLVKDTAVYLAVGAEEAAGMYANLAQGGVAKNDLYEVATAAGEIGVAFGINSEMAGESFVKMRNAMGTTIAETKKVSDAINFLSDNSAAKASEILTFMASGGSGVSRTLQIAGQDMAAIGATLISVGVSADEAATTVERFQKGLLNPASAANKTFKSVGGGMDGVLAVLNEGMSMKDPFSYFRQFGEYGTKVMLLGQTMKGPGGLLKNLENVSNEMNYLGSVSGEFANRQSTTAGQIKKLKAEISVLAIEAGNALLPVLRDLLKEIVPIIKGVSEWVKANPKLTSGLTKAVAIMAGMSFAASGLAFLFGGVAKAVSFTAQVMNLFTTAGRAATLAQWGFNAAGWANPYALIALAIAAVIAEIAIFIIYANEITAAVGNLWNESGYLGKGLMVLFGILNIGVIALFGIAWAIRWVYDNFGMLEDKVSEIVGVFTNMASVMYDAGRNIVTSIIEGITNKAGELVEKVKSVAQSVRDFFPFSPAKTGPLQDIHKIKLIETISESLNPAPLVNRVSGIASQVMGITPVMGGAPAGYMGNAANGGGTAVTINYNPVITVTGGSGEGITEALGRSKDEFEAMIKRYFAEMERRKY